MRGRALVPGEARGLAWLWCVAARWWLSRPVVLPLCAFGLWPVVGVELACAVRGFQGWCRWGGGGVRSRRGAASFLCWWAVVSHVPGWGRGARCGMVVLGCVVAFLVGGGGRGACVQVWWGGWSLVAGPLAVCASPVRSLGRPSGVFQYVGCAGSLWRGAWGSLGRGVWSWSVATGGVWSRGAWGCRSLLSGPSGAGSAVYGPRAGYCVCGVRGSVGRGIWGVLWPRCGAREW